MPRHGLPFGLILVACARARRRPTTAVAEVRAVPAPRADPIWVLGRRGGEHRERGRRGRRGASR